MRNARLAAPPESAIQLAVDMVAVCEGEGAHFTLRDDLEVDVMLGAKGLQDGVETLPRPPQELAQPRDGNTVVVGVEALVGGLKLSPEGVGLDESGALLLVVKPGAQGLADGSVARRVTPSRGGTPVEIAIEALDEVVGEADPDDPRIVWFSFGPAFPLISFKTLQNVVYRRIVGGKMGCAKRGFSRAISRRLKFPLVERMSWRGLRRHGTP
jgi:hypothetical protein